MAPTYTEQLERVKAQLDNIADAIAKDERQVDAILRQVIANVDRIESEMNNLEFPVKAAR